MNTKYQAKFNWHKVLGALVVFSGTVSVIKPLPANAASLLTQIAEKNSLEQSAQLNFPTLEQGNSLPIAKHHHRRRYHGRRFTRGFQRRRFGFRRQHRPRFHGHRSFNRRRNHRSRGFRGFKRF